MITLRPRQVDVLNRARDSIAQGHRAPIIVAPTGSGKTVCGSEIVKQADSKSKSVLFLAHRYALIKQASIKFAQFEIEHNIVAPSDVVRSIKMEHFKVLGRSYVNHRSGLDVGSVQTKSRRIGNSRNNYDIIIPDECHLSITPSYGKVFADNPKSLLVGLTATPFRPDGKALGKHRGGYYDDIVVMCQPKDLIADGLLVPFRFFIPPESPPDFSDIQQADTLAGQQEIGRRMSKPTIVGSAISHYAQYGNHRPAMYFCASVAQAEMYASRFSDAGFRAVAISGKSTIQEQDRAIHGLYTGEVEIVFNCMMYVEGLDQPIISIIGWLCFTRSLVKFMQGSGRGSRPFEDMQRGIFKDDCIVFDHVGNSGKFVGDLWIPHLGFPSDDREWSLDGAKKRSKKDDVPDITIHRCPKNPAELYRSPARCPTCDCAGKQKRDIKQVEGELVEITPEQMKARQIVRKREESQCRTLEDFIELGKSRGYAYPVQWAQKRYSFRQRKA